MTGPDDDFEEFLKRRKPVFERTRDELFEPPAEIDRVVLRQAREAIKSDEPMKVFSAPRWSVPLALAATLVLAFTVIFQAGMPPKNAPRPEVTVQNVSENVGYPQVETASGSTAADIAPPAPPPARSAVVEAASRERTMAGTAMDSQAAASPAEAPAWRRDNKAWMAEIERLRKTGNTAAADAEYAEFKRQQRAYAVAPDR